MNDYVVKNENPPYFCFSTEREHKGNRLHEVHKLVHQLPVANKEMLAQLSKHLAK